MKAPNPSIIFSWFKTYNLFIMIYRVLIGCCLISIGVRFSLYRFLLYVSTAIMMFIMNFMVIFFRKVIQPEISNPQLKLPLLLNQSTTHP